ncbi:MAG: ABC transporter permease [Nitrospiria bacterium]
MPNPITSFLTFKLVILWTDALIFLLVAMVLVFGFYVARKEHLRAPWRQIRRRPLAMSALVVLLFYIAVGLMDSIHFRLPLPRSEETEEIQYGPEVLSFLDVMTTSLRNNTERTYSAPLASHAFTKEMIETPDGTQLRAKPRLKYGGSHLANPEKDRSNDIFSTILKKGGAGFSLAVLLFFLFIFFLSRSAQQSLGEMAKQFWQGEIRTSWKAIYVTLGLFLIVGSIVMSLSTDYHILGTDKVGQDVLYLALKGIRTGLVIGMLTTLVMLPFAIFLGISAGYFRGRVDDAIQYLYTTLSSVPGVLLIAAAVLILQVYMDKNADAFSSITERADTRLLFLCIILGMTGWIGLCRLLRGETMKLREMEYVQAARALGVKNSRIITHHILPNVMHLVLISAVLDFSGLVLAEAVLSYVGVGVDPAMISWGNMINAARLELAREPIVWWSLTAAFIFMFGLVLSANVFSDAVRDAFDPRLRGR